MTSKSPVGDISVVTLIRTDTTLDHSQKAEKVWSYMGEAWPSGMGLPAQLRLDDDFEFLHRTLLAAQNYMSIAALLVHAALHASSTAESMLTSC